MIHVIKKFADFKMQLKERKKEYECPSFFSRLKFIGLQKDKNVFAVMTKKKNVEFKHQNSWNSSASDYTVPSARNCGGFSRQSSRGGPHSSRRYYERLSDYTAGNSFGGLDTYYTLQRVTGASRPCIYSSAKIFKLLSSTSCLFSPNELRSYVSSRV